MKKAAMSHGHPALMFRSNGDSNPDLTLATEGKKSLERGVCSYCYPKTEEGRTANKKAVERHRSKQ
ncbi:MAG: hypothetical protein PUP91_17110 [Rhizonema sp. PD37]|nr:hypothetical protein [Rhizonema sp. PD37]